MVFSCHFLHPETTWLFFLSYVFYFIEHIFKLIKHFNYFFCQKIIGKHKFIFISTWMQVSCSHTLPLVN